MTGNRLSIGVLICAVLLALPSCGGGGQGLRVEGNQVLVTSTSVPLMLSGESMSHVIPLEGGCGGPYVLKLIDGRLPIGLSLVDETHAIVGNVLEDGEFDFVIQITDAGCEPFSSTTASFHMVVDVGEIVVVAATRDGNPVLTPPGGTPGNPVYPALAGVVYNDFATIELIVAGGHGPYSAVLIDDPGIPNDGPLPLGASIPTASTSITGAPVEAGAFLITFKITDSVGETGQFTFHWSIDTPAIIFATDTLGDGVAGTHYSETIVVVEGIAPFDYELVAEGLPEGYTSGESTDPGLDPATNVIYNPTTLPTTNPAGAMVKIDASVYPAPTAFGPGYDVSHPGAPSEGIVLVEDTGSLVGIPRRRGTFSINVHVSSTLVPYSLGQHVWGTLGYEILQAPPVVQDPAYTLDPAFTTDKPYARLEEANKGENYDPDGLPRGLQILASGGVPDDGFTDAPHESQRATDPAEAENAYKWSIDWNPDGDFDLVPSLGVIPGMELTPLGVFRIKEDTQDPPQALVDDLVPQFSQSLAFTAADSALPSILSVPVTEKVSFGVGPDRIVVTTSSTSMATSTDNRSWDDSAMSVKYVIPGGTTNTLRPPNDSDLTGDGVDKHVLPSEAGSGTTVASLLSTIDLLRVSVNPTGYWDDVYFLNPHAARPWQGSLRSWCYYTYGNNSCGTTSVSGGSYTYGMQPDASCVRLARCSDSSVVANKALGVYTDGGKLYAFDSSAGFGVFIVRADGRLYVPAAFERGSGSYYSFGDNWGYAYAASATSHSGTKIPQMTVSPDGRIAAFKLRKATNYYQFETAGSTDILLISLTGERISAWGGESYKIIQSGATGSSSNGVYLYASSLTLTNDYLYYVVGRSNTYAHFKDHYIYRYGLFGGNADDSKGAFLHSSFNSQWTNYANSPMQVPFQDYSRNFSSSGTSGYPDPVMYSSHGYNSRESSLAPHPFRVNRQGNACAILAGLNTNATSSAYSDCMWHHVWVDYEGSLHQLSTQRRHTSGGGRGIALTAGPCYGITAALWGAHTGPTSRFEISDDGLKVAVVYFRNDSVDAYVSYSTSQYRYREDISAYVSTDSAWGGVSVREITGDTTTNNGYYYYYEPVGGKFPCYSSSTENTWRFGALTFTSNGDGLIFWGGYSHYDTDQYYHSYTGYTKSQTFVGSIYSYDFAGQGVRNILAYADGGCQSYSPGVAYSAYTPGSSTWSYGQGMIKPVGGFRSKNGDFLYIITRGAVSSSTSRRRDGALIGVNVRSVNAAQSTSAAINGHQDGRAFYVNGFGTYNGFLTTFYYYPSRGIGGYSYSSNYIDYYFFSAYNDNVVAKDTGWIYVTSSIATTSATSSTSYNYGGPRHTTYGYGYYAEPKILYVFDPNVGGDMQVVGGSGWTASSYQHVSGVVVSDDGSKVIEVGSTYTNYNYIDRQNLTVFSGIELDPNTGALPASSVTRQRFEYQRYISDTATLSPKGDAVYYGAGSSSTGMSLKRGAIGGSSTGEDMGLSTSRYAVLHAGR